MRALRLEIKLSSSLFDMTFVPLGWIVGIIISTAGLVLEGLRDKKNQKLSKMLQ